MVNPKSKVEDIIDKAKNNILKIRLPASLFIVSICGAFATIE